MPVVSLGLCVVEEWPWSSERHATVNILYILKFLWKINCKKQQQIVNIYNFIDKQIKYLTYIGEVLLKNKVEVFLAWHHFLEYSVR